MPSIIDFSGKARGRKPTIGFTLPELIIGIPLLALFMMFSVGLVIAAKQLMPGRAITVGGVDLPIAPSPAAFASSVKLHSVFIERLSTASAVYVLGGEQQSLPATASRRLGAPLAAQRLPNLGAFTTGLPMDSYGFYQAYAPQLGALEPLKTPTPDFSVVVVGPFQGQLKVTALLQVRSENVTWEDGSAANRYVRRETNLYDVSGDTLTCSFVEKTSSASVSLVGARHFWYRYDEGRVAEEGPALAAFPDPWSFAGDRVGDPIPALSHFVYCLPISP